MSKKSNQIEDEKQNAIDDLLPKESGQELDLEPIEDNSSYDSSDADLIAGEAGVFDGREANENNSLQVSKSKLSLVKKLVANIKENNSKLIVLLDGILPPDDEIKISISQLADEEIESEEEGQAQVIEGVFDGENMIGPDGKQYSVPANYASKSKLVEGDILKLTITNRGTFVYKQIGPIERIRQVGTLYKNDDSSFIVKVDGKQWRILPASVTYFKGQPGNEVVLLIPKTGESKWAAVENIIRGT